MIQITFQKTVGRRLCLFWFVYTFLCLLLLLHLSSATFNPLYNPQQHQSYYNNINNNNNNNENEDNNSNDGHMTPTNRGIWDAETPRGGSTLIVTETDIHLQQHPQQQQLAFHPPQVLLKHVSMALRLTCEWNRRLFAGVHKRIRRFGRKDTVQPTLKNRLYFLHLSLLLIM